jgi:hypothetical protein
MRKYLVIYEVALVIYCMTLQPLPSGFPYTRGKCSFLFYQCIFSLIFYSPFPRNNLLDYSAHTQKNGEYQA